MDDNQIDEIRDIATTLMKTEPELAYKLFGIILKYRPNGPFIKKSHKSLRSKLKEKLGIKNFVVIGNCQAGVIANLISEKNEHFHIDKVVAVHRFNGDLDAVYKALEQCDYIIAQNINANFIGVGTDDIQKMYPHKLVRVLNLYFSGFYPDWIYMPKLNNIRCKSPIGDYHNKTVVDSFIEGVSESTAIKRYNDKEYNQLKYEGAAEHSLSILKSRELSVDIKMTDVIENNLVDGHCDFHTFNHPNKKLLNIQVNRLLDHLSLDYNKKNETGECLDRLKLRVNPIVSNLTPTETMVSDKPLNFSSFVKDSYEIYKNNIEVVQLYSQLKAK